MSTQIKREKPIKKQFQKKKFADLAVQGTNNSSIASKRSVELTYLPKLGVGSNAEKLQPGKPYFRYFVPKKIKRSPCINRGYWLRLHAVRSHIESILDSCQENITIINLGCGYDPLPFEMLDPQNPQYSRYSNRLNFIDIDYPDLLNIKSGVIKETPELLSIIGGIDPTETNMIISERYKTIPCDLYDMPAFEALLKSENLGHPNTIKIFIAEVSLAYMKHEKADDIIASCSKFPNSHFIMLEQIIPVGEYEPFSGRMLKHFSKNESPLQTVTKYQTIESQIERFRRYNFTNVNAGDMFQLWNSLSSNVHSKIENIEPFDELEEFHLFCHHYMICHATNNEQFKFNESIKFREPEVLPSLPISGLRIDSIDKIGFSKRFGSSVISKDSIIYTGGASPYRSDEADVINLEECTIETLSNMKLPDARVCHSYDSLMDGKLDILIGGRKAPHQPFNDVFIFEKQTASWEKVATLDYPIYRHATSSLSNDKLLLFGGNFCLKEPFLTITVKSETQIVVRSINCPDSIKSSIGAAMCYNEASNDVIILGGSSNGTEVSDKLIIMSYDDKSETLTVKKEVTNDLFKRYGSKIINLTDDEYLVVGGTSPDRLFDASNSIITYNSRSDEIKSVRIPDHIWQGDELMLVGFELQKLNGKIIIFGGGATCYGFGSVNNSIYSIEK